MYVVSNISFQSRFGQRYRYTSDNMQHIYLEPERNKANKPSSLHTTDSARTSRN